jgi:hypothetical protein
MSKVSQADAQSEALERRGLAGWKRPQKSKGGGALSLTPSASSFRAGNGRQLKVLCGLEKIINIRGGDQVATRLTPTVIDIETGARLTGLDRTLLDAPDFFEIDKVVLRAAMPLLGKKLDWPVIVPISLYTVSRTRARVKLFKSVGLTPEQTQHALIGEIVGVDKGTPESRLTDSVSLIRPYCCAVFVEAISPAVVRHMANSRIAGVSLDCRDQRRREEALVATLVDLGEAGSLITRTVMARGLPSDNLVEIAESVGITHVSIRADAGDSADEGDDEDDAQREAA